MKRFFCLLLLMLSTAFAQIGQPASELESALAAYQPLKTVMGYFLGQDFSFEVEERGGVAFTVSGEGPLNETNIPIAADIIGYASGYGDGIANPVREFFETRIGELAGQGEVPLAVEQYFLRVEVTGEAAPYEIKFKLELVELDTTLFPVATHVLGPADAKHVIREFSDFQCPFCARFATGIFPELKETLLARNDVRFEFHHFPLITIHPNAFPAAEASECVVAENNAEAFWTFHDALFLRLQAWEALPDATDYFVRLAQDIGLETASMATCLAERQFSDLVQTAYDAGVELGIRGTPTVYVNGFKVANFNEIEEYFNLIELSEKFAD